jgi:hypothetical protein
VADLGEGQALPVGERQHPLLSRRKLPHRLKESVAQLGLASGQTFDRVRGQSVSECSTVQAGDVGAHGVGLGVAKSRPRDAHLVGDLDIEGTAPSARLNVGGRGAQDADPVPHRARHPVPGTQAVEDLTADPRDGIRPKRHIAFRLELVDGIHQPEIAVGHQVVEVDRVRETLLGSQGDVPNQRTEREHEPVSREAVTGDHETSPELVVSGRRPRSHWQ